MNTQKLLTDKDMTMYIYLIIQSRLSKTKEPTKEIYSICKFHTDFLKTIKLSLDTPYSKRYYQTPLKEFILPSLTKYEEYKAIIYDIMMDVAETLKLYTKF